MGDELEELYRTTYTTVVRFLYRKVWDADRAHDLAQEVFIRAMNHKPEKPRAWLFAVAATRQSTITRVRPRNGTRVSPPTTDDEGESR